MFHMECQGLRIASHKFYYYLKSQWGHESTYQFSIYSAHLCLRLLFIQPCSHQQFNQKGDVVWVLNVCRAIINYNMNRFEIKNSWPLIALLHLQPHPKRFRNNGFNKKKCRHHKELDDCAVLLLLTFHSGYYRHILATSYPLQLRSGCIRMKKTNKQAEIAQVGFQKPN